MEAEGEVALAFEFQEPVLINRVDSGSFPQQIVHALNVAGFDEALHAPVETPSGKFDCIVPQQIK
jgi:hypothetical protein